MTYQTLCQTSLSVYQIKDNVGVAHLLLSLKTTSLGLTKRSISKGVNMDKWKELSAGKKRFWVAVGILVIVAIVGSVSGWWSSPPAV